MEKIQSLRNDIIGKSNRFFDEDKKKAKDAWYDEQEKVKSTYDSDNDMPDSDNEKIISKIKS